jgi:sn-glycerol 3-phosphate transport system permease protein
MEATRQADVVPGQAVRHVTPTLRLRNLKPYWLLLPSFALLTIFTYYPTMRALLLSFTAHRLGKSTGEFDGFDNYARLLSDGKFQHALTNNLLYAVGTIVPSLIVALGFALALRSSTRLNSLLRSFLFLPTLLPLAAAAGLWSFIFLPGLGLLDYYLAKLGVGATNWLGNADIALSALMVLMVWKNAGYYMLFYIAGLQGIPQDALEAATLDGASAWQRFRHVTLPLLMPTTAFIAVIATINVITNVDHVIVMTEGGPNDATNLLLFYIYQNAIEFNDPGKAAAATVFSLAALLAISVLGMKALERGVHYEA